MRRYDRELSLEIDRTVARFNNKIKRLERQERELILPEPIERTDIVSYKSSKTTIERKLKEYQKFLERGAEDIINTEGGAKISRYEMNQLKTRQRTTKARLTREINRLKNKPVKVAGQEQAGTFSSMGDPDYYERVAQRRALDKDIDKLNKDSLNRFKKMVGRLVNKGDRDYVFKENYLDILEKTAYSYGIDKRKFDVIRRKLNSLSPTQFAKLFSEDKAIQSLLDSYSQMKIITSAEGQESLTTNVDDLYDLLVNNIDEIIEDYD